MDLSKISRCFDTWISGDSSIIEKWESNLTKLLPKDSSTSEASCFRTQHLRRLLSTIYSVEASLFLLCTLAFTKTDLISKGPIVQKVRILTAWWKPVSASLPKKWLDRGKELCEIHSVSSRLSLDDVQTHGLITLSLLFIN